MHRVTQYGEKPMPLKKGSSEATVSHNIKEIHHGPQYQKTKEEHGKATADAQAIAIAKKQQRESRARKRGVRRV